MIDYALHLGLSFWILAVLPSNLLRMIVLFILILWFYTYQNRNIKSYLLLCLMFLILLQQVPVFEPVNRKGIVKEVKKNMLIVSLPEEDVIVYGCKANISDEVELNGTYEPIVSNENFYGFSFKKWANTSGYYFSMNDENCKVIKESNSLKSKVYHRITSIEDEKIKEWLSSTLLHFSLDDTVFTMISSSGLYLSTAFYMLSSLLKRKCSRKVSDILSLSIVTFCAYITCTTLSFKRFFIFTVIQMLFSNESKQTRLGLCMITFLWCYPASALDMAFVLPVLFRFLSLFRFQKVPRFLLSLAILVPVQLYYFNECNFLQLFFFSF